MRDIDDLSGSAEQVCAANINLFLQGLRTFLRVTAQHKPAAIRERLAAVEERLATLIPLAQQWVDVGRVERVRLFPTFFRWANQSRVSFSAVSPFGCVRPRDASSRPILEQFVISHTLALRWSAYPHGCAQPVHSSVDRSHDGLNAQGVASKFRPICAREIVPDRCISSCGWDDDRTTITAMPKLVSVKQQEGHDARATAYIKAYMLFPAGILGLISMLGGVGGLGYQLIATDTYSWTTFLESSGLLLLGVLGWCRPRTIAGSWPIVRRSLPNACGSLRSRRAANRNGKAEKSGVAHRIPMGSWRLYGGFGLVVSRIDHRGVVRRSSSNSGVLPAVGRILLGQAVLLEVAAETLTIGVSSLRTARLPD